MFGATVGFQGRVSFVDSKRIALDGNVAEMFRTWRKKADAEVIFNDEIAENRL